ncbi:TerD family protein [Planococcus sp. CAU13]|uniref:TerD family protein n=1 Tax=Planococcus sp. CAU13 TaxID=1541197 RepID=UPI00052FE323|nr:TerD family protein [Planococcus sp. CAU13]
MAVLVKGQKVDLTKANPALAKISAGLGWDTGSSAQTMDLDAVALLVDAAGQVAGKEYVVFYNNLASPDAAVQLSTDNRTGEGAGDNEQILIDLKKMPPDIKKVVLAIHIHDSDAKKQNFSQAVNACIQIDDAATGQQLHRFELGKDALGGTGIIAGEVYLHNGEWKFSAVGQIFEGGLRELCAAHNFQADPSFFIKAPAPAKTEAPKQAATSSINLAKVELKKTGDKINLNKTNSPLGEILVNLNWNQKTAKGFLASVLNASSSVDLDLGCLFELKDGHKGAVQALGNAFGDLTYEPYIALDHDDRTGAVKGGENLRINGNKITKFKRILVYAFIYEGAANWAEVDGIVTLKQQSGPDIEVRLDEHRKGKRMCAIALLENVNDETMSVKKVVEYFNGHKEMDRAFKWGMRWSAGSK